MRRLRQMPWSRELVQENCLSASDFIWPVFVLPGKSQQEPIESLPGVFRKSADLLLSDVQRAVDLGIPAIALFPVTPSDLKTEDGREATNPNNLVCETVRRLRDQFQDQIGIACDEALDPYTNHGQDGPVRD